MERRCHFMKIKDVEKQVGISKANIRDFMKKKD